MIRKSLLVASLTTIPFAASLHAGSPLLKLSDDGSANVFFVADASATYSDNIFYRRDKTADGIYTIAPGFNLVAGGDGNSKFDLVVKEALTAYWDHSNLNNQLAQIDAKYTYDAQQALKATIAAGFHQTSQPTNQTNIAGAIVQTNNFNGGVDSEYRLTEKTTLTAGVSYVGNRYTNYQDLFNDTDSFSVPISWLYGITDKLDLGFTYSYSYTDITKVSPGPANGFASPQQDGSQQVHFFGLRARGSVTEKFKLEANAGVGYSELKSLYVGVPDESNTTFNFNLTSTYAVTEKLTASLSGGRNFSVGAQGQQLTATNGVAGLNYTISERWSANGTVGYTNQDFAGVGAGQDRIFNASVGVNFAPDKFWKVGVSYSYLNDDTTRPGADDFNANVVSVTASLRY